MPRLLLDANVFRDLADGKVPQMRADLLQSFCSLTLPRRGFNGSKRIICPRQSFRITGIVAALRSMPPHSRRLRFLVGVEWSATRRGRRAVAEDSG